jgi:hypothetical protein
MGLSKSALNIASASFSAFVPNPIAVITAVIAISVARLVVVVFERVPSTMPTPKSSSSFNADDTTVPPTPRRGTFRIVVNTDSRRRIAPRARADPIVVESESESESVIFRLVGQRVTHPLDLTFVKDLVIRFRAREEERRSIDRVKGRRVFETTERS